jgi:ribonuclease HII
MRNQNFKNKKIIVGLDEAGRGSLAGPVVAAAVILVRKIKLEGLRNPKKLTSERRKKIFQDLIKKNPNIIWSIGKVSEKIIDRINIKNAAELAMEKALRNLEIRLKKRANLLIIDGNHLGNLELKSRNYKLIVKADEKFLPCIIAGLVAKVKRDEIMQKLAKIYPLYDFAKNKGYPTKGHYQKLHKYGKCAIHRNSFNLDYGCTKTTSYQIKKK